MFTLAYVATAFCITSNLTWVETFWLVIHSINSNILFHVCLSNQCGPLTLLSPDWSKMRRSHFFWYIRPRYPFYSPAWQLLTVPAAVYHMQFYCSVGHSHLLCALCPNSSDRTLLIQHPIGTTCQLGLSQPANIVGSTFVLSALWYFQALFHSHMMWPH